MLASSLLMCATMAALAADGLAESEEEDEEEEERDSSHLRRLLPVAEVVLYMLSFGFGVGNVPWILLGIRKHLKDIFRIILRTKLLLLVVPKQEIWSRILHLCFFFAWRMVLLTCKRPAAASCCSFPPHSGFFLRECGDSRDMIM